MQKMPLNGGLGFKQITMATVVTVFAFLVAFLMIRFLNFY
jgi:hypothetical protein